ncbi:hypothetical protein PINS_up011511 [Pythium insidiosum]|nr:hypothetical protein PINS_up011511 [Pythium insidiosum]
MPSSPSSSAAAADEKVALSSTGHFDQDIYGSSDKFAGFSTTVVEDGDLDDADDDSRERAALRKGRGFHARGSEDPAVDAGLVDADHDPFAHAREANGSGLVNTRIADRENDYRKRRFDRMLSPERGDAFAGETPQRSYKEIMQQQRLDSERRDVIRQIQKKQQLADERGDAASADSAADRPSAGSAAEETPSAAGRRKRRRWDDTGDSAATADPADASATAGASEWDTTSTTSTASTAGTDATPSRASSRWDATPMATPKKNRWDETPVHGASTVAATPSRRSKWDATPAAAGSMLATPGPSGKRSRWDETPLPAGAVTPSATPSGGDAIAAGLMAGNLTPEMAQRLRWEREIEERNRPLSDAELDAMFPATGYKILDPPASYVPIHTPSRKLLATPTPMGQTPGFAIQATPARDDYGLGPMTPLSASGDSAGAMPFIKPEGLSVLW